MATSAHFPHKRFPPSYCRPSSMSPPHTCMRKHTHPTHTHFPPFYCIGRSLFIHSVELRDHGGYTVVEGTGTRKQGAQQNGRSASDLAADIMSSSRGATPMPSPMGQSPYQFKASPHPGQLLSGPGGGRGIGGGRAGGRGRGNKGYFVDKTVRVVGGQYTGYKGRVKHETATHVQVSRGLLVRVEHAG